MAIRLLIADDHELARRIMRSLLSQKREWEICAEATNGTEAVQGAKNLHPDVAILDICMPEINGVEAARQILATSHDTVVLLVSTYDPAPILPSLKDLGVRAFVSKSSLHTELIPAIEGILAAKHPSGAPPA